MHHSTHRRGHRLSMRTCWMMLDLDELPALHERMRFFSVDRPNLVSFHAADHGDAARNGLRDWVSSTLREAGIDLVPTRIRLLCMPRLFGSTFNPISVYLCDAADGTLAAVLYEVRNTFGQSHAYAIAVGPQPDRGLHVHHADKTLHVSPFLPMTMSYRFTLRLPRPEDGTGHRLSLAIVGCDAQRTRIRASMSGSARPLTDANLLRAAWLPLQGLRVLLRIHGQALLLWCKGAHFHRSPAAPARRVTAGHPPGELRHGS